MKSTEFCYWLQGFFEICDAGAGGTPTLEPSRVECIKRHLALVFKHEIDLSYGDKVVQAELNKIHNYLPPDPTVGQTFRC